MEAPYTLLAVDALIVDRLPQPPTPGCLWPVACGLLRSDAMELTRYGRYTLKRPREVVLLRGLPCVWSRCSFCDYIADNTTDRDEIRRVADAELAKVTGEFGRLMVINSGSIQELPPEAHEQIRGILREKNIREFYCESYWSYRKTWDQTRAFFGAGTHIFLGIETFDDGLRNGVLNKAMHWSSPADVAALTDSICLLVGFRGQTRDIIRRDIDTLRRLFRYGIVNLFTPNTKSAGLLDEDLKAWFLDEFAWLHADPNIDVLTENTAFGVG
jgi:hypothetical protein